MNDSIVKVTGIVEHGNHLGKSIGIPTINISPVENVTRIKKGVYFSTVSFASGKYAGMTFKGVTNVGCKPTVQTSDKINLETYIFDFDEDVYEEKVIIELFKFRRPERKFTSVEELTDVMSQDILACMEYFEI